METVQFRINKNLLIGILAFIAGAALSYIVFTLIADKPKAVVENPPASQNNDAGNTSTDEVAITPSTTNPDENIFTSKTLGLSFSYLKYGYSYDENDHGIVRSEMAVVPKVSGNQILFGVNYGASMTAYQKQINQSLEATISSQFLSGIPTTKCLPVRVVAGTESAYYTPGNGISYVVLRSVVPGGCPSQFDFSNPSAAFVSFSSQPEKFFYIVGGADGVMPLVTAQGEPFWVTMKFSSN